MTDYHVPQLDGSACASRNCAACSGAMGLYWQTGEKLTGAQFRKESGASCVPGAHSGSGGLFISDVVKVFEAHGATIDYGPNDDPPTYRRWDPFELERRLKLGYGGVMLGDYDALPKQYRASKTFLGDHSAWNHDFRVNAGVDETHWHDPLRMVGIWIPVSAVISYWQKPSSPIRGFAGWVKLQQGDDMTDPAKDIPVVTATVAPGGALYADPDRNRIIASPWAGGSNVGVYARRGTLTAIRVDTQSGPAQNLIVAWCETAKVTLNTGSFNDGVEAASKAALAAKK